MLIEEILLFQSDISETVDHFLKSKHIHQFSRLELIAHKTCKKNWIKWSKIWKTAKNPNFAQNQLFLTFLVFVSEN